MDIEDVNITSLPKQSWIGKLLEKIVEIVLWPFVMLFLLLLFITVPVIDFIKNRILGLPEENLPVPQKNIPYKDSNLTITKEPINYGTDQMAEDFQFSLVDHDDEMPVWRLKLNPEVPALQDAFVTDLFIDLENEIILQRIVSDSGQPSSELIGLNKKTMQVQIYKRIGLFNLFKFESESDEIVGASRTESIRIKIKAFA